MVNDPVFFISHRLALACAAKEEGYNVHVATMPGKDIQQIKSAGMICHVLPLTRSGQNIFKELILFLSICKLLYKIRPQILHLVTIKPVIYGGIAARLLGISGVVAAISGLGFVFLAKGFKARLTRKLVKSLYKLALSKKNLRVILQNPDDRDMLLETGVLTADKVVMIPGSGVDLLDFPYTCEPKMTPVVIMAARLLRDKGVKEFISAACLLRDKGVDARFLLVGDRDPGNPATISEEELETWKKGACVEILGYRNDIQELFSNSNIVVLPSYREGLPKVLVEAAASGRATVTTDVPGCRDAIEANKTGLLVPVRDSVSLADAIQHLIDDADLRRNMGRAGRDLAEHDFDIKKIVQAHMDIYRVLSLGIGG